MQLKLAGAVAAGATLAARSAAIIGYGNQVA